MPAPTYAIVADARWLNRGVVRFGNNTIPTIGGTLAYVDLNDGVNWFTQDVVIQRDRHALLLAQKAWQAKATWIGEDYAFARIVIPILYDEQGGGAGFTAALGPLLGSGEQYLTFDNVTGVLAKCMTVGAATRKVNAVPYLYSTSLEFWAKEPFFKDLTQTSNLAVAVAGSSGAGTTTNITQSYTGTWWAEPTFVLHVPGGNTRTVSSMKIANTTSGETLTVTFNPVLPASTAKTITVDCSLFKVTDELGTESDVSGAFPMLYANPTGAAQNNALQVTIVASGATTGYTFDVLFNGRWVM